MALTKLINGVRVEVSSQEEAEIQARWQKGAAEEAQRYALDQWKESQPPVDAVLVDLLNAQQTGQSLTAEAQSRIKAFQDHYLTKPREVE